MLIIDFIYLYLFIYVTGDPSAKYIRRRLKSLGIDRNLPVVYSIEKPIDPKHIQGNLYV